MATNFVLQGGGAVLVSVSVFSNRRVLVGPGVHAERILTRHSHAPTGNRTHEAFGVMAINYVLQAGGGMGRHKWHNAIVLPLVVVVIVVILMLLSLFQASTQSASSRGTHMRRRGIEPARLSE